MAKGPSRIRSLAEPTTKVLAGARLSPKATGAYHRSPKKVACARIILTVTRPPRLLSVAEVAVVLDASEAYVRRLLASQSLFGIKVGRVWGVYADDLASFQRIRRPPGRPRGSADQRLHEREMRQRIDAERRTAGAEDGRLKPRRA